MKTMATLIITGASSFLLVATAAGDVTFSDNTFNDADWTLIPVQIGPGGSTFAEQQLTGGNPGAFREITNSLNPTYTTEGSIYGIHLKNNAQYTPASGGAIVTLDYAEDSIEFGDTNGEATGPALQQGGTNYVYTTQLSSGFTSWTHQSLTGLTATNFGQLTTNGVVNTINPDFSCSGPPITFGFLRRNSTSSAPYTRVGGIDNWTNTIHVQCCSNICAVTANVNGASGPWDVSLNPSYPYGVPVNGIPNVNSPPTAVGGSSGLAFIPGDSLTISSLTPGQPTLNLGGGGLWCDANGYIPGGTSSAGSPGQYIPVPVYGEELVGTFAQNGVIVGTPFAIGNGPTTVTIPCGANQLLMGVVDGWYNDNGGSVEVSVTGVCSNSCNGCVFCLTCPDDMVVTTCSNSLPVNFQVWFTDTCCSNYTLVTVPPSGYNFPLGTNTVTSTLTDNCGNSNSCSFRVTVLNTNVQVSGLTNISVWCGDAVTYPQPVVTDPRCGTNWNVVFDPPLGYSFPPDTATPVTWNLYDCSGTNAVSTGTFWVAVHCCLCTNCFYNDPVTIFQGSNYLADPLCQGTNNLLADVLPSVPEGSQIYFWNQRLQQFITPPDTFTSGHWTDGTEPLFMGEGFLLVSTNATSYQTNISGCLGCGGGGCTPLNCSSGTIFVGGTGINPTAVTPLFCSIPPGTEVLEPSGGGGQSAGLTTYYTSDGTSWSPSSGPPALQPGYSLFVKVDNSVPVINCPSDITTTTAYPNCGSVPVSFNVTASGAFGNLSPTVTPSSGSLFPCGTNTVTCTVSNACNSVTTNFTVTVICVPGGGTFVISGAGSNNTVLTLSWPTQYIGWQLQVQTDAPGSGLGTNWYNIPASTNGNQFSVPVVPTNGSVFYRLFGP